MKFKLKVVDHQNEDTRTSRLPIQGHSHHDLDFNISSPNMKKVKKERLPEIRTESRGSSKKRQNLHRDLKVIQKRSHTGKSGKKSKK